MRKSIFKPVMALVAVSAFFTSALSFANVNKETKVASVKVATKTSSLNSEVAPKEWTFITADYIYTGTN